MGQFDLKDAKIAVVGLGYVGLPLAIEFAKKYRVTGFDIKEGRIRDLLDGRDYTNEANIEELNAVLNMPGENGLHFTSSAKDLVDCTIFIITVPTPVDHFKSPNLKPLLYASELIGGVLKKNDIVIYESTVYPGCTEEDCVPVLEKYSGLKFNVDFFCGYSPERINPGDKVNTLTKIMKVTSGSTPDVAAFVDELYRTIIEAGTYKAPSIKVAEASKAIENAQRDVNISFVNELALIFDLIGIDTNDVLAAAATKWNFLKYKPGLVGGHCIGVDPYYLAHKAESLGYQPQVILSGRRVNDNMGVFVANKVIKLMIKKGHSIAGSRALILGITFKENCPDIRNSQVIDIYKELEQFGLAVDVYDPFAGKAEVKEQYAIDLIGNIEDIYINNISYDAIILAVSHAGFNEIKFSSISTSKTVVFDTKAVLNRAIVDGRL
ncbi:nucleotide sugar dehydrogenase [Mucilaginibacter gotjawali]|uniref:UDP-N-acetyl-D-glucosamine 6-dehydrogenase n=2 Tax=Mucilaginibacter gotjawali TaxID=1550579 RepID=A0A0X8X498_9SPHI|nr:nucleotide sugar dehydrogenase [Mucilaginibacter gotjawali]MBB3057472.1 UDP-N-acetyl-D-galactosamine dehydrogenase [Mucilaginibacter gotjawali]BAU55409.1 UDP-N-acetyl-D-glucosamine 6-dehydrogenase [Mucilaginibacter gotjawali]